MSHNTQTGNQNGMNWIRQAKRLAIYLRDGLACVYCGSSVEDGTQLTLDHLAPRSKGGTHEATNLVTSCFRCNSARGNRSVRGFTRAVAVYLNHNIQAAEIERHVRNCSQRALPLTEAKALVALRGSAAKALQGI